MKLWRDLLITICLVLACGVASGQAAAKHAKSHGKTHSKSAKKLRPLMVVHAKKSKAFHPVVKPYVPEKKSKLAKHARRKSTFVPVIKPYLPDTHEAKKTHAAAKKRKLRTKKTHIAKKHTSVKKVASHKTKHRTTHHQSKKHVARSHKQRSIKAKIQPAAKKELAVNLLPMKEIAGFPVDGQLKAVNINLAENGRHDLPLVPLKLAATKLAVTDYVPGSTNSKENKSTESSKPSIKTVKANAVLVGRNQEPKKPKNVHVKEITSVAVGVDASRVKPSDAVHAIFQTVPEKKRPALASAVKPVVLNPRVEGDDRSQAEKMIDKGEAAKQPVVKIVTADLSRNEFYILGENEPVPEHLAENPETQMVVFGGEMDEGAKKIMEFKAAALHAARARAAMELAEKTASAKAIAELEVEEKEATARLMAAKKAVEEMQELKKWQMEKRSHTRKIVERATPEYKTSIVRAVVPAEIHSKELARNQKDQLVPIEMVTVSAEKVADELGAEISVPSIAKPAKAVAMITKKKIASKSTNSHSRKSANKMAEKQINDTILDIKSAKNKKSSEANRVLRQAKANKKPTKKEKLAAAKAIKRHAKSMSVKVAKKVEPVSNSIEASAGNAHARKNYVEKVDEVAGSEQDVKKSVNVSSKESQPTSKAISKKKSVALKAKRRHGRSKKVKVANRHQVAPESAKLADGNAKANVEPKVNPDAKVSAHVADSNHSRISRKVAGKGKKSAPKIAKAKKKARQHIVTNTKKTTAKITNVEDMPHELTRAEIAADESARL